MLNRGNPLLSLNATAHAYNGANGDLINTSLDTFFNRYQILPLKIYLFMQRNACVMLKS